MPQLEQVATYIGQIFWLLVTFGLLYLFLWKSALPKVTDVLRERQERIDDDLEKAQQLKDEAESVLHSYETAMADARSKAQTILREAADAAAKEAEARHTALSAKLAQETEAAELRIGKAREEALANVRSVAAKAAQDATTKLVGGKISKADAEKAVSEAMEGKS